MSRVVLENNEFLVEDAEGVSFNVSGNNFVHMWRSLQSKATAAE